MSQLALFLLEEITQDEPTALPLPLEDRCWLWVRRQSGVYAEITDEIDRVLASGRPLVCLHAVLEMLADQPDLAKSFGALAGYDPAFAKPLRKMIIGFGDAGEKDLDKEPGS